jgi:monofunctional biosynthetic peptidoglycan transglycosylase
MIFRWIGATAFWTLTVTFLWVGLLGMVDPPVTWHMAARSNEHGPIQRERVSLKKIARELPLAVIASEDQRFMTHHGFEWDAMQRALDRNKKGRKIKGASTITQQTAKNVFLWHGRTYLRKGLEAWFTLWIEVLWTKERILEVYLNTAEMGKGIFGAEAAAQNCFNRSAAKLTSSQAALITATLPNPVRYNCRKPGPYIQQRQQWVLRQMRNIGDVLDPEVRAQQQERREREEERKEQRKKRIGSKAEDPDGIHARYSPCNSTAVG